MSTPQTRVRDATPLHLAYTNHRGETSVRRIIPLGPPVWQSTEWHPEPQWLLRAFDVDKDAERLFALKGFAFVAAPFQERVRPWLLACFGEIIAGDREERNHRFLEESLELVQSCGCTAREAHQLVDYVFGRPVGEPSQEAGGVMVTLAALCLANHLDMHVAAETELARIWTKVDKIREKQAAKPKYSPLPEYVAAREPPRPVMPAIDNSPHLDLDELERRARAATPGPWSRYACREKLGNESCIVVGTDSRGGLAYLPIGSQQNDKFHAEAFRDAAHIASFDPQTVLALIAWARLGMEAKARDDGWQDIETAPKDGTRVWLYWPNSAPDDRQTIGWWYENTHCSWWMDHADSERESPTHWRPLPPAPQVPR